TIHGLAPTVVFVASAVFVMREGAAFIAPILVSILLAYALEPLVGLFMRASLPRWAAVVLTFAVVAATLASGARMARRQTIAFLDELPATVQAIEDAAFRDGSAERRRSSGPIHNLQRAATDLQAAINGVGTPASLLGRHVAVAERFDVRNYLLS